MQLITIVAITSLAASVSAFTPANPFVKHLAARVVYVDGSYGNMAKRQTSCPAGYTACGSGCAAGPCCDAANGLACRPNETCATVNGQLSCCPVGYTCDAVRSCQNAIGGCVPGSVNNGVMCCDATAPLCLTSSSTPYCAGVAPSTTYTVPAQTAGASSGASSSSAESTSTLSLTSTATQTVTMDSTSNAITSLPAETAPSGTSGSASTSGPTETVIILPTGYSTAVLTVVSGSSTYTTTATMSPTSYTQITVSSIESSASASGSSGPTASGSSGATASGSMTSTSVVTATAMSTSTYTAVVSVYPTANSTYGNATATIIAPTQATGAASRFSVSAGCALGVVMGLFYLL